MRAASYVLPPGDNDMYDDMPELEDYVDVVADLLMVILPQNRGPFLRLILVPR